MVNAFRYGTPPHGGFAFGLDRLVMLMLGEDSLREVIAFPKIKDASCLMTDAPNVVDQEQLEVLGLPEMFRPETAALTTRKKAVDKINMDNIAELSKLSMSEKEKEQLAADMADIIAFVNQLEQLDTTGVPATAHVVPLKNVFREDEPHLSYNRDDLLAGAPRKQDGYIFVPQVVE